MIDGSHLLAALMSGLAVSALVGILVPTPARLAARVRPYTMAARSALRAPADVGARATGGRSGNPVGHLFGQIVRRLAVRLGSVLERMGDAAVDLRLRQAGFAPGSSEEDRVAAYRTRQLGQVVGWGGAAFLASLLLVLGTAQALVFVALALVVGATRQRGRLEREIERRRERMRIEIYTVNQLLAIRVRTGGGVVQAVQGLVDRSRGEVVSELAEALRIHRSGARLAEAFMRIAATTPEPFCARTYSLLAVAEDRGVDLAAGLLALAEDVREARRETMRRAATRRRAAMLVPTIAILAPVMLLFVGAPLPSLLLGFR